MIRLSNLLATLSLLLLSACAAMPPAKPQPPHPLVLISLDGFRYDYLDRGLTPNLNALADSGARGTMKPAFPSLTFPNHYTLVTGKTPDRHGMVANYMYDPTHPSDPYFDKTKAGDGYWWQEATPMWVSAEQAGLKVGASAWPGTVATIDGVKPSYIMAWSKEMTPQSQVAQVLDVLGDPPAEGKTDPRYDLIYWGSLGMLNPAPGYEAVLEDKLVRTPHDHMQCWDRDHIPAKYAYGHNPRVTKIVCLGEPGWQVGGIVRVGIGTDVGNHGYDPETPEMTAIFVAAGPDIKPGTVLPRFDNVDVYGLEMKLLHLAPEPNDGTLAPLKPALR
ncbi:MAG: alkaline phosphatase family protein [Asticcacaulis sp.]|nr:alkaline phosphatase family protein [Asticcacaulis sp.]